MKEEKLSASARWKLRNPDKVRAQQARYRKTEAHRISRAKSAPKNKAYLAQYREELRGDPVRHARYIAYHRAWQRKNRIKIQDRQNAKNRRRKQKLVQDAGGACSRCGYSKCLAALEFHHLDPTVKESTVAKLVVTTLVELEVKKCILVCSNCHREIHAEIDNKDRE